MCTGQHRDERRVRRDDMLKTPKMNISQITSTMRKVFEIESAGWELG